MEHDPFEELGRLSLDDHDLPGVMARVAQLTRQAIPGADSVSVTLLEGEQASTVAQTDDLAVRADERQYRDGYGPCLDGIAGGQSMHVPDMTDEPRWPDWAADAAALGVRSSLSIPMPLQREVAAALNIYATKVDAFDDDSLALAQRFAAVAGVALANTRLYDAQLRVADQLATAMHSRAVIEQAKGIVMSQERCSAERAFELLVERSQHSNTKLKDVAAEVVRQVSG